MFKVTITKNNIYNCLNPLALAKCARPRNRYRTIGRDSLWYRLTTALGICSIQKHIIEASRHLYTSSQINKYDEISLPKPVH
jgi:hypothetical protein